MRRPRLLDLFCGAGGASMGYHRAGFEVTGVDHDAKRGRDYPFTFVYADAIEYVKQHGHEFDVLAGSPPCQRQSHCQRIRDREHPDLIGPMREAVQPFGKPYVIENVEDARQDLIDPIRLCGAMFAELNVYRHRLFESNVTLLAPEHPPHREPQTKMGRAPQPGHRMHVVGNFIGVAEARRAMGIDWMVRDDLREAIPPAYTQWIGARLLAVVENEARPPLGRMVLVWIVVVNRATAGRSSDDEAGTDLDRSSVAVADRSAGGAGRRPTRPDTAPRAGAHRPVLRAAVGRGGRHGPRRCAHRVSRSRREFVVFGVQS